MTDTSEPPAPREDRPADEPAGGGTSPPAAGPVADRAASVATTPAEAPAEAASGGRSAKAAGRERLGPPPWLAGGFLAPALVLLALLVVYPIVYTLWRSLYDADGGRLVWFDNYVTMFTDSTTFTAIKNNAIWVAVAPALITAFGLIFAVLTERIRWAAAFKVIVFMPMAISMVAAGVIFTLVYDHSPERGVLNAVAVGVHDTFAAASPYPGVRPREQGSPLKPEGKAFVTTAQVQPGQAVTLPLVAVPPAKQRELAPARAAAPAQGAITGTVWADFAPGGGKVNQIDGNEKGLPKVEIEALAGGKVAATTTSRDDGTFTLDGLAPGSYTLRLAESNFAAPYNGVTWLGPGLVTPAIIGAYVWMWAGFAMVLIGAGLAAIPRDALEAARVDGATEWQVFRRVTIPLLAPVLMVVFVTLVINVLKIFDLVYIMAPGSSVQDANVLALRMYLVSFIGERPDQGLGSAIAVVLFLLVLPAMIFNIRRFRAEQG
ncbi:alpha-glucoside transport system permease protein [Thermomonospora echinospora]|uniref:Alpha-glucoside transport system permease protein n=1 Tax=Thermomonospora echinospora TaxID=1992 RepID=A0A1H6C1R3_9ACTN|nr:ABC transporter permease subunit [Thermomonospora echinospora]SEG66904.1 alpha-glucoside transport system permease protein [Thermomonospora echinospora]